MSIPIQLERDIQRQVLDYLRLRGAMPVRVNSMAMMPVDSTGRRRFVRANSEPGCSDILCCWRGRFLAIEVKRPGGRLTAVQRSFLDAVASAGGIGAVVCSIEDAADLLDRAELGGVS